MIFELKSYKFIKLDIRILFGLYLKLHIKFYYDSR